MRKILVTAALTGATLGAALTPLALASGTTSTVGVSPSQTSPGVGEVLWGGNHPLSVAAGSSVTFDVALYSTGPAESVTVKTTLPDTKVTADIIKLPAVPNGLAYFPSAPNGAGGTEGLYSPHAYVWVPVTVTVPAGVSGTLTGTVGAHVNVAPVTGKISTSPGVSISIKINVTK